MTTHPSDLFFEQLEAADGVTPAPWPPVSAPAPVPADAVPERLKRLDRTNPGSRWKVLGGKKGGL